MKERIKVIAAFILGLLLAGTTVYAATIISSINVGYNNASSKLVADNVQEAIDEVYKKASESKAPQPKNENIKAMYYYDENKESEDFCVTGDEKTCKVNTCYLNNTEGSCSPGTIVEYMVNEKDKIRFHVIKDNGSTLTLQSQQNTINSTVWDSTQSNVNTNGPNGILQALEQVTSTWINVNNLNYSIGEKNSTLGYSGCTWTNNCTTSSYILKKELVKARLTTLSEVYSLGCNYEAQSCPIWLYNYLRNSATYGGINGGIDSYYWTLTVNANSGYSEYVWVIYEEARFTGGYVNARGAARAVVEITKS